VKSTGLVEFRLARARSERPRQSRAGEEGKKVASSHGSPVEY
jgi:hypothetical protein